MMRSEWSELLTAFRAEASGLRSRFGAQGAGAPVLGRRDVLVAIAFFLICFALYGAFAFRLAQGEFLNYWNLGFDLDPSRYVVTMADDLSKYDEDLAKGGAKHPLLLLLRPASWPFMLAGFDVKETASLAKALYGAATVVVIFLFLRVLGAALLEASSFTVLYALSGAQLFNAFVVDSYGYAMLAIAMVWLTVGLRYGMPERFLKFRLAVAVLNFGITVSNLSITFFTELLLWIRELDWRKGIARALAFFALVGVVWAALIVIVWNDYLFDQLKDPVLALKKLYWLRTHGERVGVTQVLLTFFGFSFVSPNFSHIPLPEGIVMWDFREFYEDLLGLGAFLLWAIVFVAGAICSLTGRFRGMFLVMLLILLFNVYLHLDYQYRGSVYLYAAHTHIPIFLLIGGLAVALSGAARRWRAAGNAVVLALALIFAVVNVGRALEFVVAFDAVNAPIESQLK